MKALAIVAFVVGFVAIGCTDTPMAPTSKVIEYDDGLVSYIFEGTGDAFAGTITVPLGDRSHEDTHTVVGYDLFVTEEARGSQRRQSGCTDWEQSRRGPTFTSAEALQADQSYHSRTGQNATRWVPKGSLSCVVPNDIIGRLVYGTNSIDVQCTRGSSWFLALHVGTQRHDLIRQYCRPVSGSLREVWPVY